MHQLVAGEHATGPPHQRLQHGERAGPADLDLHVTPPHPPLARVQPQPRDGDLVAAVGATPAAQRVQPGQQLVEGERLGQVVVGARTQARDPVAARRRSAVSIRIGVRRRTARIRRHTSSPSTSGSITSSTTTSYGVLGGQPDAVEPGRGQVRGHALLEQALTKQPRQLGLVLDQEDPHEDSVRPQMSRG